MCEQCANLLKYTKRKFVGELILQVFSTFPKCGAAKIVKFVTWDMRCLARLEEFDFMRMPLCVIAYYVIIQEMH